MLQANVRREWLEGCVRVRAAVDRDSDRSAATAPLPAETVRAQRRMPGGRSRRPGREHEYRRPGTCWASDAAIGQRSPAAGVAPAQRVFAAQLHQHPRSRGQCLESEPGGGGQPVAVAPAGQATPSLTSLIPRARASVPWAGSSRPVPTTKAGWPATTLAFVPRLRAIGAEAACRSAGPRGASPSRRRARRPDTRRTRSFGFCADDKVCQPAPSATFCVLPAVLGGPDRRRLAEPAAHVAIEPAVRKLERRRLAEGGSEADRRVAKRGRRRNQPGQKLHDISLVVERRGVTRKPEHVEEPVLNLANVAAAARSIRVGRGRTR